MNWKFTLLLCLVFFATTLTLVTNIVNSVMISSTSLQNIITASNSAVINTGSSVEPAGDPVDNPWEPL